MCKCNNTKNINNCINVTLHVRCDEFTDYKDYKDYKILC